VLAGRRGGVLTTRHRVLTIAVIVAIAALASVSSCSGDSDKSAPSNADSKPKVNRATQAAKENDGRVRDIQKKCSETTDEGKAVIEKVKAWKPVVNERPSDKSLGEIATEYASKGLHSICWGASKKTNGKWKIVFSHIDIQGAFQDAEWEHDPASGEFKPFNAKAMEFWYGKL
jgi:hypothetical protein